MPLRKKMKSGVFWTTIDRFTTQLVQFVVGIVIARIVSPAHFGVLGILLVFVNLSQVFVESGFGKALIQKNNPTDEDCSTVFYFNLGVSLLLYLILWFAAPFIGRFYNMPELVNLMHVVSFVLVLNAFIIVPQALFSIRLDFKSLTIANFISAILSGIIGIFMALKGFDIWALVAQTLSRVFFLALIQLLQLKWKPLFVFSKSSFKTLYSYSVNLFASSFIGSLISELNSMVIGKIFKPDQLGFYSRGTQFAGLPFSTITSIIYRVLFPALASVKEDKEQLVAISKGVIRYASFISFPLLLWIAMIAEPMVRVLLTEKWMHAVPIIQIICVARMISIVAGISVELLNSVGRSDLSFRQDLLKMVIRIIFLLAAFKFGIIWIAFAELAATSVHFFINTYYPGKILKYGAFSQIKDFFPILTAAFLSSVLGYFAMSFIENDLIKISVSILLSIISYVGFLFLFNQREIFEMIKNSISRFNIFIFREN